MAVNKDKCDEIFPYDFAKQTGTVFQYPLNTSIINNKGRKKLPPISDKKNKKEVIDDFMDLLDGGEKS